MHIKELNNTNIEGKTLAFYTGIGSSSCQGSDDKVNNRNHEFIVNITHDILKNRVIFKFKGGSNYGVQVVTAGPIYSILLEDVETQNGDFIKKK